MALPSSPNQISLGDIRTEFSLAAGQIAMSDLYSKGNAPASGEIQIGADFHGVSAETIVGQATVTPVGTKSFKSGLNHYGYTDSASENANGGTVMGGLTSTSGIGSGMTCAYFRDDSASGGLGGNDFTRWRFSGGTTYSTFSKVRVTSSGGTSYTITSIPTPGGNGLYQFDHGNNTTTNIWNGSSSVTVEFIQ
jgi:hypothetical protein